MEQAAETSCPFVLSSGRRVAPQVSSKAREPCLATFRHEYEQIAEAAVGPETNLPGFPGPAASTVLVVLPRHMATATKT